MADKTDDTGRIALYQAQAKSLAALREACDSAIKNGLTGDSALAFAQALQVTTKAEEEIRKLREFAKNANIGAMA